MWVRAATKGAYRAHEASIDQLADTTQTSSKEPYDARAPLADVAPVEAKETQAAAEPQDPRNALLASGLVCDDGGLRRSGGHHLHGLVCVGAVLLRHGGWARRSNKAGEQEEGALGEMRARWEDEGMERSERERAHGRPRGVATEGGDFSAFPIRSSSLSRAAANRSTGGRVSEAVSCNPAAIRRAAQQREHKTLRCAGAVEVHSHREMERTRGRRSMIIEGIYFCQQEGAA